MASGMHNHSQVRVSRQCLLFPHMSTFREPPEAPCRRSRRTDKLVVLLYSRSTKAQKLSDEDSYVTGSLSQKKLSVTL